MPVLLSLLSLLLPSLLFLPLPLVCRVGTDFENLKHCQRYELIAMQLSFLFHDDAFGLGIQGLGFTV